VKRNRVSAVCACGRFVHAKDHEELTLRLAVHFRNCPTTKSDTEATAPP
jgi:hypothetical protein